MGSSNGYNFDPLRINFTEEIILPKTHASFRAGEFTQNSCQFTKLFGEDVEHTFEPLVVMDFSGRRLVVFALQNGQKALVNADVLLFRLDHPDPLFAHAPDDTENVDRVRPVVERLQNPIQGDESARTSDAGAGNG